MIDEEPWAGDPLQEPIDVQGTLRKISSDHAAKMEATRKKTLRHILFGAVIQTIWVSWPVIAVNMLGWVLKCLMAGATVWAVAEVCGWTTR